MLRQVVVLVDQPVESMPESTFIDPETRVVLISLDKGDRPPWLAADTAAGFHTFSEANGAWRVYVRESARSGRIAGFQTTEVRDEIALNSAAQTVVPLAILLPLLAWIASRIIRREFAFVRESAQALDRQSAQQPEPLPALDLPQEIAPFAHAINRLLERVARLMEAQRRFVADAAHELRSPLTALSLQAENVEQAPTLGEAKSRTASLRLGIDRARRLSEQLLLLAGSQAARVKGERIGVGPFVRDLLAEYFPLSEGRGIDLGVGRADEAIAIDADPELLRVVLRNALDNALRYTPAEGEITLGYFMDGDEAVIEIADTGPGIRPSDRERAFEPFRRLDGALGEGSGLGLAIASDAALRVGAALRLDERAGGGLVFQYRQSVPMQARVISSREMSADPKSSATDVRQS
jgi:two-component system OmpR family sensor kinase